MLGVSSLMTKAMDSYLLQSLNSSPLDKCSMQKEKKDEIKTSEKKILSTKDPIWHRQYTSSMGGYVDYSTNTTRRNECNRRTAEFNSKKSRRQLLNQSHLSVICSPAGSEFLCSRVSCTRFGAADSHSGFSSVAMKIKSPIVSKSCKTPPPIRFSRRAS